jgi:hypothetical protein
MLFPALTWLLIQFSMSGVMLGTSADAMQIEICTPFGVQQIEIDPETGEPVAPFVGNECDWCQSFGALADHTERADVNWVLQKPGFDLLLSSPPTLHKPLRLVAGFQSRAPPSL